MVFWTRLEKEKDFVVSLLFLPFDEVNLRFFSRFDEPVAIE